MARPIDVLVVDDEPGVVKAFGRLLDRDGYQVRSASSGQEALRVIASDAPHAILLDLRMPRMDGLEFLRQLRRLEHGRTIPVAVVTGDILASDDVLAELNSLGVIVRFKPMDAEALATVVDTLVAPSRA